MFLASLIFAWVVFSKMERTFFFLGFCPPSIRAGGEASIWTRFCENYFSGDMDFRKTETNVFEIRLGF
ncbi:hypothetical protein COV42_03135 [Candidatus Campbellbacteria bacterium CG11_big_fil_rev_8_21_14_0_20_44_21]|nr:MAG: hypothetical protein COV42_03135 [Candidatus Campbellbacteria bacterium CG11_big_fil_rev_8_21_14_0_20_44_21]